MIKIYKILNFFKANRGGGFTINVLLASSLLTISLAALTPSLKELVENCCKEVCIYNRQIILRSYNNYKILNPELTIAEILQAPQGEYFINKPSCPTGGKLFVEMTPDGESLKCDIHTDD